MQHLSRCLTEARDAHARRILISSDGVFSMDGTITPLREIVQLADAHEALVHVDDSHATGYIGANGRGTHEYWGVSSRVDIITSTLGKALGGAAGGFTAGKRELIALLRQRSRPYLFSNSLPPVVAGAALHVFTRLHASSALAAVVRGNAKYLRERLSATGLTIIKGETAIVPVMVGDAALAVRLADAILKRGVYVIAFSYPVVPVGKARIRVQVGAADYHWIVYGRLRGGYRDA